MYSFQHMMRWANKLDVSLLVSIIINKLKIELRDNLVFNLNFSLNNYSETKMDELLNLLNDTAKKEKLDLKIDVDNSLLLELNLKLSASYVDNMFVKFVVMEKYFYKLLKGDNNMVMDFSKHNLGKLYVLHALETANYHVGNNTFCIILNGKKYEMKACNRVKRYHAKVVTFDEAKYCSDMDTDRKENKKRLVLKR